MRKKKLCVLCRHAVGRGDRHAKDHCPPKPGKTGEHYARKQRRKRAAKRDAFVPTRGQAVAGTGVPKGE
jgi:hypothetical protein